MDPAKKDARTSVAAGARAGCNNHNPHDIHLTLEEQAEKHGVSLSVVHGGDVNMFISEGPNGTHLIECYRHGVPVNMAGRPLGGAQ